MNTEPLNISIIGAGGIGSNTCILLVNALRNGVLAEQLGEIEFHLYDADKVEEENLIHQRFTLNQIGMAKVDALAETLGVIHSAVQVIPHSINLRDSNLLSNAHIVIVAVDRPEPRRIVHSLRNTEWYDSRCMGDFTLLLSDRTDTEMVDALTPEHLPASCQPEGAIESGAIQFGFANAAVHLADAVMRSLLRRCGQETEFPDSICDSISRGRIDIFGTPIQSRKNIALQATKPWTDKDDLTLLDDFENSGKNFDDISRKLGRSPNAIFHRLRRLMSRENANAEVGE
ncbi:MAG: hypothetical protein CMB13_01830 [Euryarchaeota archaeon]|nr:hypothetical protein [Euryarchaeota archaeon]|tara:strand:+ start:1571 stop:2431 length:861 start_codon:yes stop_codon:yes gene_type:complete